MSDADLIRSSLVDETAFAAVFDRHFRAIFRFLRGRGPVTSLERWQTNYLPVYAGWAAIVVIAFPPVFGFD